VTEADKADRGGNAVRLAISKNSGYEMEGYSDIEWGPGRSSCSHIPVTTSAVSSLEIYGVRLRIQGPPNAFIHSARRPMTGKRYNALSYSSSSSRRSYSICTIYEKEG